MIYLPIPKFADIDDDIDDMSEYNNIRTILNKHCYSIAYYGKDGINFYKITDAKYDIIKEDGEMRKEPMIPISSYYSFSRKEFVVFIDALNRLDDTERKLNNCLRFINKQY
jgi:hypothetical protein